MSTRIKMFAPKPGQPGSRLTFIESRNGAQIERTGSVWSSGPVPSSVWVQPDDDPQNPVAVKLPSARAAGKGALPRILPGYPASWQRDAVRRCDNVLRFGHVFGVVDEETKRVSWHADPACADVTGKPQYESSGTYQTDLTRLVIDVLLGRYPQPTFLRLCPRCVYLDDTAEKEGAA
jgi:hypothetical protein